jgi:hypothetical protein
MSAGDRVQETAAYREAVRQLTHAEATINALRDEIHDRAQETATATQALHDIRGLLGFDNDGDKTPGAQTAGAKSIEKYVAWVLLDVREHVEVDEEAATEAEAMAIALRARAEAAEAENAAALEFADRLKQMGYGASVYESARELGEDLEDFVALAPLTAQVGEESGGDAELRRCDKCGAVCDHRVRVCECGPECPYPPVVRSGGDAEPGGAP